MAAFTYLPEDIASHLTGQVDTSSSMTQCSRKACKSLVTGWQPCWVQAVAMCIMRCAGCKLRLTGMAASSTKDHQPSRGIIKEGRSRENA